VRPDAGRQLRNELVHGGRQQLWSACRSRLLALWRQTRSLTWADGDNLGHNRKRIHLRAACEVPQTWSVDRYDLQMASPSASSLPADPAPPPADPIAIRACLSPRLVAKFDADWDVVLDQAKVSKDLAGVHSLLHK
jgi:Family of unknown function (DUF6247)